MKAFLLQSTIVSLFLAVLTVSAANAQTATPTRTPTPTKTATPTRTPTPTATSTPRAQPDLSAEISVSGDITNSEAAPIGVNGFGDPGGTVTAINNLIGGGGFEPISVRRFFRVSAGGADRIEVANQTEFDLTGDGFFNGAEYRVYRIVDEQGKPLPLVRNYLDASKGHHVIKVREGRFLEKGSPQLTSGSWVVNDSEEAIYFGVPGPEVLPFDFLIVNARFLNYENSRTHPRVRQQDAWVAGSSLPAIWAGAGYLVESHRRIQGTNTLSRVSRTHISQPRIVEQELPLTVFDSNTRTLTVNAKSGGATGGIPPGTAFAYEIWESTKAPAAPQGLRLQ